MCFSCSESIVHEISAVGEGASTSDLLPILNAARAQFYAVMLATMTGGFFIIFACMGISGAAKTELDGTGPPDMWYYALLVVVQFADAVLAIFSYCNRVITFLRC